MYSFESSVRFSETDHRGQLNIYTLLNYFQDCSTRQSELLGSGVTALHNKNLVWVISTWNISVNRFPRLGEDIIIGTFPYEYRSFFGKRNFLMKTKEGEILAVGDSLWTLLDWKTGSPKAVTPDIIVGYEIEEKLPMDYTRKRIIIPENVTHAGDIRVGHHHLDANMHVNNCRYLQMALPYLPDRSFKGFRAEYRKMSRLDDILSLYIADNDKLVTLIFKTVQGEITTVMELTK